MQGEWGRSVIKVRMVRIGQTGATFEWLAGGQLIGRKDRLFFSNFFFDLFLMLYSYSVKYTT